MKKVKITILQIKSSEFKGLLKFNRTKFKFNVKLNLNHNEQARLILNNKIVSDNIFKIDFSKNDLAIIVDDKLNKFLIMLIKPSIVNYLNNENIKTINSCKVKDTSVDVSSVTTFELTKSSIPKILSA